jgi:hypothetical protein
MSPHCILSRGGSAETHVGSRKVPATGEDSTHAPGGMWNSQCRGTGPAQQRLPPVP